MEQRQGGNGNSAWDLAERVKGLQIIKAALRSFKMRACTKLGAHTYALTSEGHILVSLRAELTSVLFLEESPGSNAVTQQMWEDRRKGKCSKRKDETSLEGTTASVFPLSF